tara:strand:- start:501 stop:641 length:141 start_codon:yes stop_codon:yes gene_type:complete
VQTNQEKEITEVNQSDDNLIGFFSILMQVDKRINPHNYTDESEEDD